MMSEIEEQLGTPCETHDSNEDNDTEYDTHKDSERQLMFEWRQLEERLRIEEVQRQAELEAEKEQCLKSEEKRRCRNERFKEELRRTEATNQSEHFKPVEADGEISQSVQVEMVKQQELIKRLEEQIAEERRVFEEVQQEEVKRTEARCAAAAARIQAAFRGALVRRWHKKELNKRREEERRKQEERKERERRREMEERVKMESEKERRRVEQEQQRHREAAERRRVQYERAKEQERHRLERERQLEEQRRKAMEEAKRIEDERKRSEEEKQKRVGEMKTKQEENAKRIEDEIKRKAAGRTEEGRMVGDRRKGQQHMENKSEEHEKATEEEIKRNHEKESPEMMEVRRVEEVRRKAQEEKEKTRKAEEKAKKIEDEMTTKDEEKERRAAEERRTVAEAKKIEDESQRKEEEKQKRAGEMRIKEGKRNIQEVEAEGTKQEENANRIGDEIKRKAEKEAAEEERRRKVVDAKSVEDESQRKEEEKQKRVGEMRIKEGKKNVQEVEAEKNKQEENANRIGDEIKRKAAEEERRRIVEDAKKIEDESQRKEEEKQKSMGICRVAQEDRNVQVNAEKESKGNEETKGTEDETQRREQEMHRQMKERRRKEENQEKQPGAGIIRKEEEEKQKRMNEKRAVGEMKNEQNEQTGQTETEQRVKNDIIGEQIVMERNDDGQNSEGMNGNRNEGLFGRRENTETDKEGRKTAKRVNISKRVLACTLSPTNGQDRQLSFHLVSTLPSVSSEISSRSTVSAREKNSVPDSRGPQCAVHDDSSFACLRDSTEQKRLAWMMTCTPWAKLSVQNKRKRLSAPPRRTKHKRAPGHSLLPLPVDIVLRSGPWSSLKQVTSVTLEDLSSCSLSTLSECTRLQSLTLRRCRLEALDGLKQCTELQHIDLQENSITYVDCQGLVRLRVLLLGRNQLTSIHGLDDAVNLTVLQLSHNIISRISGLGSLKKLHRLAVDRNQLISTRGLSEAFTLLHLDCSYNHLIHVEGLENCALLNTLDLRGNNLTELPVLKNLVLLRELYLDDNSIFSLHGLESCWLPLLRRLSVSQNSITQLPLLVDLLSLETFNVSHNCLSELSNICMSLQGCSQLQELSISDNPVQQDDTWRSSVLAVNPGLIKLNGEQTGASGTLSADSTQLWSVQALCQAHQDQIDSVLKRHSVEISSAPSALIAQLLVGKHTAELFQLAEKQRYDHEYGDSSVCETARQEPVSSSHLQELPDWDLAQQESAEAKDQQPEEHTSLNWQAPYTPNFTHQSQSLSADHNAGRGDNCMSPTQKFSNTQPGEETHGRYCAHKPSRMDLKTVAVMVIQRRWRERRQKKSTFNLGPPAKAHAGSKPQKELQSCESRPERLNKDYAAITIQAVWRGYWLRKRLTRALRLAQIPDGDEAFEEVDVDEFVFDEDALERDWNTLQSDMSSSLVLPYSEQQPLPKLPLLELHKSTSVQPWNPRQAWTGGEEAPVSEQSQSPDSCTRLQSPASTSSSTASSRKCTLSERSEKISKEWGFSSSSTAVLMLKRAQRMKARKQPHQRIVQDPAVHLPPFRNHRVRPVAMTSHKSRSESSEELKAGRGNVSVQEVLQTEPGQKQMQMHTLHRTYQWLQTQAVPSRRSSAPSASDHFLPEIDPEILNGGRVQLVASTGNRETPDSAMNQWIVGTGLSLLQHNQAHTRTSSAGHTTDIKRHKVKSSGIKKPLENSEKEVLSPQRVTLAPSRKERISFRDNPLQLSGGWGGGKKRSKANTLK